MGRNYTVRTRIKKPVSEVFAAVIDSDRLCRYFTDKSSGPLAEGERIIWNWQDFGDHPVTVTKVVEEQLIELCLDAGDWNKDEESYPVRVIFEFASLDNGDTMLSISEAGWRADAAGLKASYENCGGWQHMAMCLKAYLEYGIDLR